MRNLASAARLNLILEQNARMGYAVGRWQEGMDPDVKERFPCWRYVGSTALSPRDSHARYAGHVYSKDDPIWHRIFPPSDFGCKCSVEDCDAPPEKAPKDVQPAHSGFAFDPAHAFEKFDLGSIKTIEGREKLHDGLLMMCQQGNFSMSFYGASPQKLLPESYREPGNIEEIREVFRKVANRKEEDPGSLSVSVGNLLPEHAAKLGLKDFNGEILFKHPGTAKAGSRHWQNRHDDTLNEKDAIELFRLTIWNPNASVREDINGSARRLVIYVKDRETGKLSNIWVVKDPAGNLHLELIDSWTAPRRYIDDLEK